MKKSATGATASAEPPPPRRKSGRVSQEEAARRREALLVTALNEFLRHGFERANLDRIANRCGISKMTIYRQIGGKQDLFLLACEHAVQSLVPEYEAAIAQGGAPEDVLRRIVRISQENSSGQGLQMLQLSIGEGRRFPALARTVAMRTRNYLRPTTDYIRSISLVPLSEAEAERSALLLNCMASGGFLKLMGDMEPESQDWAAETTRIFLAGLGLGGQGPD